MKKQPAHAIGAAILCSCLLLGTVAAEAGVLDAISSGAGYVWQGVKNKANNAWIGVTDSAAGKFIAPSARNKRDKERILNVLLHEGALKRDENGKLYMEDEGKLREYYRSLQTDGVFKNMPRFSPEDGENGDKPGMKYGQFWQNFIDGKDHERGDEPASMDPFETNGRGLATTMHAKLQGVTDSGGTSYADAAGDLKVRGIDILDKDLRQGVAAAADVYIKALDTITAGKSSQAVKWMEEAAKVAKETSDDPKGAAAGYIQDKVKEGMDKIKGDMTDKAAEALKSALGEDRYDTMMSKYEKYGDKQEKMQKIMDEMAKLTGDKRIADAAEKFQKFSPDAIAEGLTEKVLKGDKEAADKKDKGSLDKKDKEGLDKKGKDALDKKDKEGLDKDKKDKGVKEKLDKVPPENKETKSPPEPKPWSKKTNQEKHDDLKNNEPETWNNLSDALKSGDSTSALQWLSKTKSDKSDENTKSSIGLNQNNQQITDASTSGDQQIRDAGKAQDQAGADAQNMMNQSSAQTASDQQENSWNNAVGNALAQGLAAGGAAFGNAVGANAAANAGASLFGPGKRSGTGTDSDKSKDDQGGTVSGPKKGGATKGSGGPTPTKGATKAPATEKEEPAPPGVPPPTPPPAPTAPGATTLPPPTQNCPTCGKPMTAIVAPTDPSKVDDYRWACFNCGTKDNRPLPTATVAAPPKTTPPAVTATPPTKPAAPKGWKCPVCGSYDTKFKNSHPLYGDVYHCNGCGGTVHYVY